MVSIKTFLIIAVASGLILVASPQNRVAAENPVPEIHLLIDLDHDTGLKRIGPGYGVSRLDDEGTACTQEESLAAAQGRPPDPSCGPVDRLSPYGTGFTPYLLIK